LDNLIEAYNEYLGLSNATFSRIDHNDAMVAVVYKVDLSSEKSLILKIFTCDNDFHRELYFLNALAGVIPVPKVEKVVEPVADREGAILMGYFKGSLLKENDWTYELAHEVGEKLALLHSERSDVYGDCMQNKSYTKNAREYFQEKFFEELKECVNHLPEKCIKYCKKYYESHQKLLDFVDGPCMVHRDFHPGNIIVNKGSLVGIVDWASGRFGFAEQDFCSMEHKSWPINQAHKEVLLVGYSSVRKVPYYNAIRPLLFLGRTLAVIGFTITNGTWNDKDKEIYHYNRQFLDSFFKKNI
jgi:Ser/Thr protein kinase RdoA (MazF antagonist)